MGDVLLPKMVNAYAGCLEARTRFGLLRAFLFDALDRISQPVLDGFFKLNLIALAFHGLHGFSVAIERDVVAGNVFALASGGHKVGEQALAARMGALRIVEVDAGERVLKDGRGLPRRSHRAPIASLLEEIQFELEDVEDVTLINGHDAPPRAVGAVTPAWSVFSVGMHTDSVMGLTGFGDQHHTGNRFQGKPLGVISDTAAQGVPC